MKTFAWISTVLLGAVSSMFLSPFVPDIGSVVAIGTIGTFIMYTIEQKK